MDELLEPIVEAAQEAVSMEGTYLGEDGLLHCRKCGGPRQYKVQEGMIVSCICSCQEQADEVEKAERLQREKIADAKGALDALGPLHDRALDRITFDDDDAPEAEASRLARRYVDAFPDARREGLGLVFSGGVGTGKSFFASCIVNAVRERWGAKSVLVPSARLVTISRAAKDSVELLDRLAAFDLVALDDLGAERSTDYAVEVVESFVDARVRAGLPLIVTTNLTGKALSVPSDLRYARLFDRVRQGCPKIVPLVGASRRGEVQRQKAALLDALLKEGST